MSEYEPHESEYAPYEIVDVVAQLKHEAECDIAGCPKCFCDHPKHGRINRLNHDDAQRLLLERIAQLEARDRVMRTCKYPTIGDLLAAFQSGELDKNLWTLVMDNDGSRLKYVGPVPSGIDCFRYVGEMNDTASLWFRGGGYDDIVDLCNAVGIPCVWC